MRTLSAILIMGLALAMQARAEVRGANHWYTLTGNGKWCSYSSLKAWMGTSTYTDASARIAGDKVEALEIVYSDEGGDWGTTDTYSFRDGQISGLERTKSDFTFSHIREHYAPRGDTMVRTSRRYLTEDDKPLEKQKIKERINDFPFPAHARLDALPFYPVLFEKPKSGKVCKPGIQIIP